MLNKCMDLVHDSDKCTVSDHIEEDYTLEIMKRGEHTGTDLGRDLVSEL